VVDAGLERIPTTIPHVREPHCCGCLTGTPVAGLVIFRCNECGEEVGRGEVIRRRANELGVAQP
jgi:predicted RNA-binding Zn-ribbon protein involved in translation (DUF1610 family)